MTTATLADRIMRVLANSAIPTRLQPPQAQREPYPFQGFIDFQGLKIDVENAAGSYREGRDRDGHAWRCKMYAHYGEIRGTEGTDGDKLDVYVGPLASSRVVVVVDQTVPTTGRFDEQKVIVGFDSEIAALNLYRLQYDRPGFYGGHRVMDIESFKTWCRDRSNKGERIEKASDGLWVPIVPSLGARLHFLALFKAAGHRYIKRVPTGKFRQTKSGKPGAPIYRYFYNVAAGGGVANADDMKPGAGFKAHGGHWHIEQIDGDHLVVRHDETGEKRRLTRSELAEVLRKEHAPKIEEHAKAQAERLERERAEVREHGTDKQRKRLGVPTKAEETAKDAPAKIEAVGDHIWGSRKDLAVKRNIESSADLEGMSYTDAAAIVSKARLVTPLAIEDAKAMGMSPGVAHLFMALLGAIRQKPDDSKAGRAAYVDEIRSIQGAMTRIKTVADFEGMISEMRERRRRAPDRVVVETLDRGTDYRERLTQLKKDNPGVDYKAYQKSYDAPVTIEKPVPQPYDSLGAKVTTIIDSRYRRNKTSGDWLGTLRRAEALERQQSAGWDWLEASTAKAKEDAAAKAPKAKSEANTDRGFSDAKEASTARRVGGRAVPDANAKRVKETFNLREVDYGQSSYMTQADREYHTKALEGALHDLADVMGVRPELLSFQGRLGIAMGARGRNGRFAAHYEAGRGAINLTKFAGGGTLAHEWGHALDNIIAGHFIKGGKGSSTGDTFLTQAPEHSALPPELSRRVRVVMDAMIAHPDASRARAEHASELGRLRSVEDELIAKNNDLVREHQEITSAPANAEARDRMVAQKRQNISRYEKELNEYAKNKKQSQLSAQRMVDLSSWIKRANQSIEKLQGPDGIRGPEADARLEQIAAEVETLRGSINQAAQARRAIEKVPPLSSAYMRKSAAMDKAGKAYWSTPHEMFARAFETYVSDKLHQQGRENTYLVRPHVVAHPYPEGEEKQKIHAAMDDLFQYLSTSGNLEKALRAYRGNHHTAIRAPGAHRDGDGSWWVPVSGPMLFKAIGAMMKAAGHRYIKRVPTGNPKRPWRYFYKLTGTRGIGHEPDIKTGTGLRGTSDGKLGHFHVQQVHDDGTVTISHDESGATERLDKLALVARLEAEHASSARQAEQRARRMAELEEARQHGTPKQQQAAKRRAVALGAPPDEALTADEQRQREEAARASAEARRLLDERDIPATVAVAIPTPAELEAVTAGNPEPVSNDNADKPFAYSASNTPNWLGLRRAAMGVHYVNTGREWPEARLGKNPILDQIGFTKALDAWSTGFFAGMIGSLAKGDRERFGVDDKTLKTLSPKQESIYREKIVPKLTKWWSGLNDAQRDLFATEFVDHKLQEQVVSGPRQPVEKRPALEGHEDVTWTRPAGMESMPFELHPYQKKAVNFATKHANDNRALWAMEMGLGKTASAIAALHVLREQGKVQQALISAPGSAHGSWEDHFKKMSNLRVGLVGTGLSAKKRQAFYDAFERGELDVLVVTPDSLGGDVDEIMKATSAIGPSKILRIADEVHLFKTPSAKRTQAFRAIMTQPAGHVIAMTGTVKPNRPEDFYHIITAVNPRVFGGRYNLNDFARDYCTTEFNRFKGARGGEEITGFKPEALAKLHEKNAATMFVRTVRDPDVDIALPERIDLAPRLTQDDHQSYFHEALRDALGGMNYHDRHARRIDWLAKKSRGLAEKIAERQVSFLTSGNLAIKSLRELPDRELREIAGFANAKTEGAKRAAEWRYRQAKALNEIVQVGQDQQEATHKAVGNEQEPPKTLKEALSRAAKQAAENPLTAMTASLLATSDPRMLSPHVERFLDEAKYPGSPKALFIADAVAQHLENNPSRGAVIFGTYVRSLERMKQALLSRGFKPHEVYVIHGQAGDMREAEAGINSGKYKVVVAQVDKMSTGANLQGRADFTAFLDTPPKPATITQAIARVWRQGQKNKVTVVRPVGSPMEARVEAMVAKKIRQSTQLQGKEMGADAAVLSGIDDAESLTHEAIHEALGVSPQQHAPSKEDEAMPEGT